MKRLPVLCAWLTFLQAFPAQAAETLTGKVVAVADGDTLTILVEKTQHKIRVSDIDCPERGQPFGTKARQFTSKASFGHVVTARVSTRDRYDRLIARVVLPDGKDLSAELVKAGLAWHYKHYSKDKQLAVLELAARKARVGLWLDAKPTPPWDWRKQQRAKDHQPTVQIIPNGVEIVALLPNPKGEDRGQEQVTIANRNEAAIDLEGWKLRDRGRNEFRLADKVPARERLTVKMTEPSMPLNNDGDEVVLVDNAGVVRNHVAYGGREVRSGRWIEFGSNSSDAKIDPKNDQRLDNLDNDATSILRQLPGVALVTRHGPQGRPSQRVVHLLDWHFVPKDMYTADLRSQSDEPLSDEDIDRAWKELLREVAVVQDEQMAVIGSMIWRHGLRRIYIEGLTDRDVPILKAKIAALRKVQSELASLRSLLERDGEALGETAKKLDALEQQLHRDLLQIGAAGRLLMDGKIEAVLPLEEAVAHKAANPVTEDGAVVLDQAKIEARQDAQAKRLLAGRMFNLIILGGDHDLSDNLDRLSVGRAEYIRVGTKGWQEAAQPSAAEE